MEMCQNLFKPLPVLAPKMLLDSTCHLAKFRTNGVLVEGNVQWYSRRYGVCVCVCNWHHFYS